MSKKRIILEIGCGDCPWPIQRLYNLANPKKSVPSRTTIMDEFANIDGVGSRYFFLDNDVEKLKKIPATLKELKLLKQFSDILLMVRSNLVAGDGRRLPFADKTVDAVILSDVLSAPEPDTIPFSEPYPDEMCISSVTKRKVIKETLRVLRDDGKLVISICLTPCYARPEMEWLETKFIKKRKIQLIQQCGKFVGDSDDWHLYHVVFQKGDIPIQKTNQIPWTQAQERYIEEYATSWTMY